MTRRLRTTPPSSSRFPLTLPAGHLGGKVVHLEKLSSDTNIIVKIEAAQTATLRLFGQYEIAPDEAVHLDFDDANRILFDTTGARMPS